MRSLIAALEGMKERGEGTKVGDKTLVDALEPALQAFGQPSAKATQSKGAGEGPRRRQGKARTTPYHW